MEPFAWKRQYNTNIQELDDQHRHFFDIINHLRAAVGSDEERSALVDTFTQLIEYMQIHFSTEEKLLERLLYPELKKHIELHEIFVEKITGLFSDYLEGKDDLLPATLNYSQDWLVTHILNEDMKYVKYISDTTPKLMN